MAVVHDPVRKASPAAPDPSRSPNTSRSPGRYIKDAYQPETTAQQIGIAGAGDRRGGQVPPTADGKQAARAAHRWRQTGGPCRPPLTANRRPVPPTAGGRPGRGAAAGPGPLGSGPGGE